MRNLLAALTLACLVPQAGAAEEVTAAELLPLEEASWPMRITSGPGAGSDATLTLEPVGDDGLWSMTLGDRNRIGLRAGDGGSVVAVAVELTDSGRRIVFDPPALLIPGRMSPGQTSTRSGGVKVFDVETGEQSTSGSYEQTLPPPSTTSYQLPGGSSEAWEVSNVVEIETDWASVKLDTALGLSERHGPVYRRLVSDVTKAAFFGEKTTRTIEQRRVGG